MEFLKIPWQIPCRQGIKAVRYRVALLPNADINFLLSRLRSTPGIAKTPVVALTARKVDKVTEETLTKGFLGQRGVERIFKKPPEIKELFTAVQHYCAIDHSAA
jgi:CheY-like chemotaxis protein